MAEVFVSYAPEDERLFRRLQKHLGALYRQGIIAGIGSRAVMPGTDWRAEADRQLASADLILLLISPDYLDSDYCYDGELRKAVERHRAGEAVVIPVIIQPVFWQGTPFADLQAVPTDGKPITAKTKQGMAWLEVVQGIVSAVRDLEARRQAERKSA